MEYEIELLKNSDISTSVVAPSGLEYTYRNLYTETEGIFANIYGNFYNELMTIADKIGNDVVDNGVWVYLQGAIPVPAKLKETPTAGSTVDTDDDGIYDIDELESIEPIEECDLDEIITKVSKGIITGTNYGKVKAYKYKSNPAVSDTDNDGYLDDEDCAPKDNFVTPVVFLHGRGDNTADCFGLINGSCWTQ